MTLYGRRGRRGGEGEGRAQLKPRYASFSGTAPRRGGGVTSSRLSVRYRAGQGRGGEGKGRRGKGEGRRRGERALR